VYGLAASAQDDDAVARIFAVKGRPPDNPLPIFISSIDDLPSVCDEVPATVKHLAEAFWPGALTIVLPKAKPFRSLALVGGETVAVRVPGHELVLAIVKEFGRPVTGTSANLSGFPSPSTAYEADAQIGEKVDLLIDGGRSGGTESTIIDLTAKQPSILRQGAVPREEIERVLGTKVAS
jgi:L-threonylcarbamoyladenylate synthase